MARRFAKVSEEEIEEAFFYPSDLVNTKLRVSVYIHHYSPPLRGIVVYYYCYYLNSLLSQSLLRASAGAQTRHLRHQPFKPFILFIQ